MTFTYAPTRRSELQPITPDEAQKILGPYYQSVVDQAKNKGVGLIYGVKATGDCLRAEANGEERQK
jgi:hypothetical protein